MCAYDSQAKGTDFLAWSEWCHIFDRDEWDVLGYAKDVGRWYQVGEGSVSSFFLLSAESNDQHLGATMGVSPVPLIRGDDTDAILDWLGP
jgi:hypothetical protein